MADRPWDRWCREEAQAYQGWALRRFLAEQVYPYSPLYRKLFDQHGIRPDSIRSVKDLARVPFTTKSMIVASPEHPEAPRELLLQPTPEALKASAPLGRKLGWGAYRLFHGEQGLRRKIEDEYRPVMLTYTTGRTSAPTPFLYTLRDLEAMRDIGARIMTALEIPRGDRGLNAFPAAPHLAFWQVVFCGFEGGVLLLHTGGGKMMGTEGILLAIEKMKPTLLMGVPSYIYHLLHAAKEKGISVGSIERVVAGGDRLTPAMRVRLADLLKEDGAKDPRVSSVFGFTESRTCWPECIGGGETGFHLFPDYGIVEIVDPKTGEVLPDGQTGELTFTSLDWRGSCVLRYRTGDIVEGGLRWDRCPGCGRTCPRISSDIRRVSNVGEFQFSKVRGTLVDFNVVTDILNGESTLLEWQIVLQKANDDPFELDEILLYAAPADGQGGNGWIHSLKEKLAAQAELTPNRIIVCTKAEIDQRLGIADRLKEQRILDRRKESSKA